MQPDWSVAPPLRSAAMTSMNTQYKQIAQLAKIVIPAFRGKRREKFEASISILRESLLDEQWAKHGKRKTASGFYQGILRKDPTYRNSADVSKDQSFKFEMCLRFGLRHGQVTDLPQINELSDEVVQAWFQLCHVVSQAIAALDEARPKPVITAVGLSPKVTKTLLECDLDIDLPTITMPPIEKYYVQDRKEDGTLLFDDKGEPVMVPAYRVRWTKGVKFGQGRFGTSAGCQVCGKAIPSQRFVPIEAECRNKGRIALWLGCDCARNIFGVKDIGLSRDATAEAK